MEGGSTKQAAQNRRLLLLKRLVVDINHKVSLLLFVLVVCLAVILSLVSGLLTSNTKPTYPQLDICHYCKATPSPLVRAFEDIGVPVSFANHPTMGTLVRADYDGQIIDQAAIQFSTNDIMETIDVSLSKELTIDEAVAALNAQFAINGLRK